MLRTASVPPSVRVLSLQLGLQLAAQRVNVRPDMLVTSSMGSRRVALAAAGFVLQRGRRDELLPAHLRAASSGSRSGRWC